MPAASPSLLRLRQSGRPGRDGRGEADASPNWRSDGSHRPLPRPSEGCAVDPDPVQDHGELAGERHLRALATDPLFRLAGFQVGIDWSWAILAVLITWTLAVGVFPHYYPGLTPGLYLSMGAIAALGLFASIVLHELAHSLVARRYGVPIRGITLFIFGGVAQMDREPDRPGAEFAIAIAGPIASFLVGLACWLLLQGAVAAGRLVGCISMNDMKAVPRERWATTAVSSIMQPCSAATAIPPGTDAMELLSTMSRTQNGWFLVMEGDRLLGVVTLKDMLKFLSLKLELKGPEKADLRLAGVSAQQRGLSQRA